MPRQITTPGIQGNGLSRLQHSSTVKLLDRQEISTKKHLVPVTQIVKVGTAKPTMVPSDAPKVMLWPEYPLRHDRKRA